MRFVFFFLLELKCYCWLQKSLLFLMQKLHFERLIDLTLLHENAIEKSYKIIDLIFGEATSHLTKPAKQITDMICNMPFTQYKGTNIICKITKKKLINSNDM